MCPCFLLRQLGGVDLDRGGKAPAQVGQRVVKEGHTRFKGVGHRDVVVGHQEAVEECSELEFKGPADSVEDLLFRGCAGITFPAAGHDGVEALSPTFEHRKHVAGKQVCQFIMRKQSMPGMEQCIFVGGLVRGGQPGSVPPGIAGEEFITTGAGKADLDELAGEFRDVPVLVTHAHAWVIHVPRNLFHGSGHVAGMEDDRVMLGLEQVGELLGECSFIKALLDAVYIRQVEAAREGVQPGDAATGCGDDRAAVHAAREVGTDRYITDQLTGDCVLECRRDAWRFGVDCCSVLSRIGKPIEVALDVRIGACPRLEPEEVTRREQFNLFPDGPGSKGVLEGAVLDESLGADRGWNHARGEERLGLRGECQVVSCDREVDRLHAETISHDEQFVLDAIVDREGEHAVEPVDAARALAFPEPENDLGIRCRLER